MEEPSSPVHSSATKKYLSGKTVSASTFQREFELGPILQNSFSAKQNLDKFSS
jgi:hypothetical protein